jgi:hypothetical protein
LTSVISERKAGLGRRVVTAREKAKDSRLKREFQLTLEEYNKIWKYQGECCAICKRKFNKDGKPLLISVDHDHTTGEVRGLLCWVCNKGIAVFQDSPERLANAHTYFKQLPVETALGIKRFTAPGRVGTKKRKKLLLQLAAMGSNGKKTKKRRSVVSK